MPISHGTRRLTTAHQVSCYLADVCLFRIVFAPCQVFISQEGPFFIKFRCGKNGRTSWRTLATQLLPKPKCTTCQMSLLKNDAGSDGLWASRRTNAGTLTQGGFTPTVVRHLGVQVAISSAGNRSVPARQYGQTPFGAPLCSPRLAVVL